MTENLKDGVNALVEPDRYGGFRPPKPTDAGGAVAYDSAGHRRPQIRAGQGRARVMTEIARETETVRVSQPDRPENYVDFELVVEITYADPATGDTLTLRHIWPQTGADSGDQA